ncbi:MAG: F0F1 ATP synthase subunit B [Bacilli bacterium]|nr:F0F1 ATP synthase subunit B [Bacilli bacterium]
MKLFNLFIFLAEENAIGKPESNDFISKVIPNFWAFLVQLFAFIIMIIIVIKFAYKPVSKFLAERKRIVNDNLTEAEEKNKEANKNLEEAKIKRQETQKEAIQIIQDAKKEAEAERGAILEDANQALAKTRAKAMEDIELAKAKAMKEMHDEVVDIAMEATKNILGREVNNNDDKALLDDFVSDLIDKSSKDNK